jgi:hypothetical protein
MECFEIDTEYGRQVVEFPVESKVDNLDGAETTQDQVLAVNFLVQTWQKSNTQKYPDMTPDSERLYTIQFSGM